ncbi:MAG TPA: hypothetical protein VK154_05935 [Chitinophagales bacterium]|nr:hypothetical protein [Chitinophagales bacterium]
MKKLLLSFTGIALCCSILFAQNVGIGTNDPKSKLDINGGLSLREGPVITLVNGGASGGANDNIILPDISAGVKAGFYRIAGPTAAFSIYGIVPLTGADGQMVTLVNTTSNVMTIKNNGSSVAANSLKTLTNSDMVSVAGNSSVTLQYNKTESKWYVTGSQNYAVTTGSIATGDITSSNSAVTLTNNTGRLVGTSTLTLDIKNNELNQKGLVPGPTGGNGHQVWGTDVSGNPAWQKVNNNQLTNNAVTVSPGTGMSGGGTVALGGTITLTNTGDLSTTNEAQTLAGAGTNDINLTQAGGVGGGTITLQGTGATTVSRSGNTFTINSTNSGGTVTAVSASNGLNSTGGVTPDIKLGGTLSTPTTIALGGNDLRFTGTGNVGIGTGSPLAKLHVRGGKSYFNQLGNDASASYTAADLVIGDNTTTRDGYGQTNGSHIFLQSSDKSTITALDESNNLGQISYQNLKWTLGENIGWGAQAIRFPVLGAGYVKSDASGNLSSGAIAAADVPVLNQNTTGNAATATNVAYSGVTAIPTRTTWSSPNSHRGFVAEQLAWKNYGNNHTIFDASAGTSPDGGAVNNTTAQVAWSATYPTLMGWNGTNTYGVRVDASRVADNVAWTGVTGRPTALSAFTNDLGNYGAWIPNNGIGDWQIASSSTSTSYTAATLELRESNLTNNGSATPPHLGFHWGGVVASNIAIESSGRIAIRDNPGSGYENFIARTMYSTADIYNNAWYRGGNADDNHVKLYGNSRQMVFRTDGTTQYSDNGGYPFVWLYGGDNSGNRRMILDNSGNIWTNTYGWLHNYFAPISHTHTWAQVTSKPAPWLDGSNLIEEINNFNLSKPSGFYQGINASNAPGGSWYNMINVRHSNAGNDHGFQLAASYYDSDLYSRTYQGGSGANNGTYTSWARSVTSKNLVFAKNEYYGVAGANAWNYVTTYTAWMDVKAGDNIKLDGMYFARCTGGSNNEYFYTNVEITGQNGCGNYNANQTDYFHANETGSDHDNFKPVPYMDVWTCPCSGQIRFRLMIYEGGDDNWESRENIITAVRY